MGAQAITGGLPGGTKKDRIWKSMTADYPYLDELFERLSMKKGQLFQECLFPLAFQA